MPSYFRHLLTAFIALLACLVLPHASAEEDNSFSKGPVPDWVEPVKYIAGAQNDDIRGGIDYLLVESQSRAGDPVQPRQVFRRFRERILNQAGLDDESELYLYHNPEYQQLTLHQVDIIRDGHVINKLDSLVINSFQTEERASSLIYGGDIRTHLIIDDLRIGDELEYSFTLTGSNPVYQQLYATTLKTSWAVPVSQLYYRVIWEGSQPLNIHKLRTTAMPSQKKTNGHYLYEISQQNTEVIKENSEKPSWSDASGYVFLTMINDWEDVERWAEPMYRQAIKADDAINQIVKDIRSKTSAKDQQIVLALQYVQDNIRYLGLEMGSNSHQPTAASETLQLRYGDCKDKAVLLVTILQELGITAYPALVDTEAGKALPDYPASHQLFDHVITWVENAGQSYWLDPTRRNQGQILSNVFQPDYGYALLVGAHRGQLTPMQPQNNSSITIHDDFYLNEDNSAPVKFETSSEMLGWFAENFLNRLEPSSLQEVSDSYLSYYQNYYDGTTVTEPLTYERLAGKLQTHEHYQIENFWEKSADKLKQAFYPASVRNYLYLPDERDRTSPFSITYPVSVTQIISVHFPDDQWFFENEKFQQHNDFFNYDAEIRYSEKQRLLTLTHHYESLQDNIPAQRTAEYIAAVNQVLDQIDYHIFQPLNPEPAAPAEPAAEESTAIDPDLIVAVIFCLAVIVFIVVLISWLVSMRRNKADISNYYAMPMWQFVFLMVSTLGLYYLFWVYRNWKHIRYKDLSEIHPAVRSFFSIIWFFTLYRRIAKDFKAGGNKNLLASTGFAILATLLFIVSLFISKAVPYTLVALTLMTVPFIAALQLVNDQSEKIPSRLHWRHWLLAIITMPLLAIISAQELYLLPAANVVKGDVISQNDRRFMDRKGVLPINEKLLYFYSDAYLDLHADGNGFSENRVFSYWKDDSGFYFRTAELSNVKDIRVKYSQSSSENTLVTIVTYDGDEFVLYVSADNHRDRLFINSLKSHWNRKRNPADLTSG